MPSDCKRANFPRLFVRILSFSGFFGNSISLFSLTIPPSVKGAFFLYCYSKKSSSSSLNCLGGATPFIGPRM